MCFASLNFISFSLKRELMRQLVWNSPRTLGRSAQCCKRSQLIRAPAGSLSQAEGVLPIGMHFTLPFHCHLGPNKQKSLTESVHVLGFAERNNHWLVKCSHERSSRKRGANPE